MNCSTDEGLANDSDEHSSEDDFDEAEYGGSIKGSIISFDVSSINSVDCAEGG